MRLCRAGHREQLAHPFAAICGSDTHKDVKALFNAFRNRFFDDCAAVGERRGGFQNNRGNIGARWNNAVVGMNGDTKTLMEIPRGSCNGGVYVSCKTAP